MTGNQRKNIVYSVLLLVAMVLIWSIRELKDSSPPLEKVEISGTTMGTTYQVKYLSPRITNFKASIDSLLEDFNLSLSTYIPESEISQFNHGTLYRFKRPYFYAMLVQSKLIYHDTDGAFDPTVMPLVSAWGFGPETTQLPSQKLVDSLLQTVGFDNLFFDENAVCKLHPNTQLDFSAIAKGYAVDLVMGYLETKGLEDIFVEIGGEIAAKGVNETGKSWAVYVEKPEANERAVQAVVSLDNIAIATSGNYRNFYIKEGKKYAHTISPFTGDPVQHSLLSVSVFARTCAVADAYATAFMVMGFEKALHMVEESAELEAYFIYTNAAGELATKATLGVETLILE